MLLGRDYASRVRPGLLKILQTAKLSGPHDFRIYSEALAAQIADVAVTRELHISGPVVRSMDICCKPIATVDRHDIALDTIGGVPMAGASPCRYRHQREKPRPIRL